MKTWLFALCILFNPLQAEAPNLFEFENTIEEGEDLLYENQLDSALDLARSVPVYEILKKMDPNDAYNLLQLKNDLLLSISGAFHEQGNDALALEILNQDIDLKNLNDHANEYQFQFTVAYLYHELKQMDIALSLIDQADHKFKKAKRENKEIDVRCDLLKAKIQISMGNEDLGERLIEKAFKTASAFKNSMNKIFLLVDIGNMACLLQQNSRANFFLDEAINHSQRLSMDEMSHLVCQRVIFSLSVKLGQWDKAMDSFACIVAIYVYYINSDVDEEEGEVEDASLNRFAKTFYNYVIEKKYDLAYRFLRESRDIINNLFHCEDSRNEWRATIQAFIDRE